MIYTHHNACGATVHDVEAKQELKRVKSVNTATGVIDLYCDGYRMGPDGEFDTFQVWFESVYPIVAGSMYPVMFHCYGRIDYV